MSTGAFARRSRLSPKTLRLYDGLGLLSPARVDEISGYRCYERDQLDWARLSASLRHVEVPLAVVKEWMTLDPTAAADLVTESWHEVETATPESGSSSPPLSTNSREGASPWK